ncbi:methyltransferase domain-containing protein [Gluconacetobacter tumulisoli]|nr:methyltransferase domain-containing protein [Gluconacetobacter tumulisoli]
MNQISKNHDTHWNRYYASDDVPMLPSQFSVFVASEFPDADFIVDIGCGNGRDAFFFCKQGYRVVAVDASAAAIESIQDKCGDMAGPLALQCRIDGAGTAEDIRRVLTDNGIEGRGVVYARFFLHAIDQTGEDAFLEVCRAISTLRDVSVAVEFRTVRDKSLPKETPDHFRRYLNPPEFVQNAARFGFRTEYLTEGFGFAKYKSDDAHVARVILAR